jgi:hypothetical protein
MDARFPLYLLCSFKLRSPCSESCKLLISAVVVADALVKLCDLCHLIVSQAEIEDVEIISYVMTMGTVLLVSFLPSFFNSLTVYLLK